MMTSQRTVRVVRGGMAWCARTSVVIPLFLLITVAGGAGTSYAMEREWQREFPLSPGSSVSVENVQGSIWVEAWDRAQVEATVAMRSAAPTDRLDDVQVAVEAGHGSLAFHTLYPGDLKTPVRVDYHLRVPRQVRLEQLSTLEGAIAVRDVEGLVNARSLHGDIEGINITGSVAARALTGNIRVSLRSLPDKARPLTLETVNGGVVLELPARANADVELATVAGHILGHYAFEASATPGDSTKHIQLGAGGVHIKLRTVRGDLRVVQRQENL